MVPMFPLQTLLLGGEGVEPWETFVNVADCVFLSRVAETNYFLYREISHTSMNPHMSEPLNCPGLWCVCSSICV